MKDLTREASLLVGVGEKCKPIGGGPTHVPSAESFVLAEYSLAHNELRELWSLYWRQASYFLTFNAALLAFVSHVISSGGLIPQSLILSAFGLLIALLWLFHGNRYFYYIRDLESHMRLIESCPRFEMRLKRYQASESRRLKPSTLERFSGSRLRNTTLPILTIGIWLVMIVYLLFGSA